MEKEKHRRGKVTLFADLVRFFPSFLLLFPSSSSLLQPRPGSRGTRGERGTRDPTPGEDTRFLPQSIQAQQKGIQVQREGRRGEGELVERGWIWRGLRTRREIPLAMGRMSNERAWERERRGREAGPLILQLQLNLESTHLFHKLDTSHTPILMTSTTSRINRLIASLFASSTTV